MKELKRTGIIAIILLSLTLFSMECLAIRKPADVIERLSGQVSDEKGAPVSNAEVIVFDGFTFHNGKTDINGKYNIPALPVSKNNYMVIYFTKEGFIPVADNIMAEETKAVEHPAVMKRSDTPAGNGFIIGAVYQPVRGGKVKFNNGIRSFSRNTEVHVEGNGKVITKETDGNGHFLFEVPAGTYILSKGGIKEKTGIDLSKGKTVIRNIRSGLILID